MTTDLDAPSPRCPLCEASFSCERDAPDGCWCAELEPLGDEALGSLSDLGPRCLCPRCLAEQIARAR